MSYDRFAVLKDIIQKRRSGKPVQMNGKKVSDYEIEQLLELANWAPTHGRTEPWRFIVYSGEGVQHFCRDHAELYKKQADPAAFQEATYEKLMHQGDKLSHVIAVYCKRGINPKIPLLEEIAATAAAVEHVLLGAEALGISILWSTGGMTLKPIMKDYYGLGEEDTMMGLLYVGYADDSSKEGTRVTSGNQKAEWVRS